METWEVVKAFTIGPLLEVAIPKPGNVNRYKDFEDLTFYHFLFANTAVMDVFFEAAERGKQIKNKELLPRDARLGELIKKAVENSKRIQTSNPNFGIIALAVPLIVALTWSGDINSAREKTKILIHSSTPQDTIEFYRAIRIANPKGIKKGVEYDVYDDSSFDAIVRDEINLWKLAEISSKRELIFKEWLNGYELSYSTFEKLKQLTSSLPLEKAALRAFLELLATKVDTLIIRKAGVEEAFLVQETAKKALNGKVTFQELDSFLREKKDLRNPGSLADIMAIALSMLVLNGYKLNL